MDGILALSWDGVRSGSRLGVLGDVAGVCGGGVIQRGRAVLCGCCLVGTVPGLSSSPADGLPLAEVWFDQDPILDLGMGSACGVSGSVGPTAV